MGGGRCRKSSRGLRQDLPEIYVVQRAQMPKTERLRFWKSHIPIVYIHAHTVNISLLLSHLSQLEHSIYTPKASQPPQFGKHSRPTIYTTPSALTTLAAISVIIDEPRFVVSGFPYIIYTYRCIIYIYCIINMH